MAMLKLSQSYSGGVIVKSYTGNPRPVKYREVNAMHVNGFLGALQALSKENDGISMWETQLQFTYKDYNLERERVEVLLEKVSALHENLKPEDLMEIPGTEQQSKSKIWFSERWRRLHQSVLLLLKLENLLLTVSQMQL